MGAGLGITKAGGRGDSVYTLFASKGIGMLKQLMDSCKSGTDSETRFIIISTVMWYITLMM
jgi:hypothetical protein